jgi:hypothetical protein
MSLKSRVARLQARTAPAGRLEVAWVYYVNDDHSSIKRYHDGRGAQLFVGWDAPHPFPAGTHIYGIQRGLPYPPNASRRVEPRPGVEDDDAGPLLSAETVGVVLDELDGTLPSRLAAIVRAARVVVIIGDREDPRGPTA